MKTSELKKIVEARGYRLQEGYASVSIKDKMVTIANITKSGRTFSILDGIGYEVVQAIVDYAYTPLEEREEEKKYWVVLPERDLQRNAIANEKSISILTTEPYKTQYTLKQMREIDFLKEIDGKWYMKLELEEIE